MVLKSESRRPVPRDIPVYPCDNPQRASGFEEDIVSVSYIGTTRFL